MGRPRKPVTAHAIAAAILARLDDDLPITALDVGVDLGASRRTITRRVEQETGLDWPSFLDLTVSPPAPVTPGDHRCIHQLGVIHMTATRTIKPYLSRADLAREMEADLERQRANRSPAEKAGDPTPKEQAELDRLATAVAAAVTERDAALRDVIASQSKADRRLQQGGYFIGDPANLGVVVSDPKKLADSDREAAALERFRAADFALQSATAAHTRAAHRVSLARRARFMREDMRAWKPRKDDDRAPSFFARLLGA